MRRPFDVACLEYNTGETTNIGQNKKIRIRKLCHFVKILFYLFYFNQVVYFAFFKDFESVLIFIFAQSNFEKARCLTNLPQMCELFLIYSIRSVSKQELSARNLAAIRLA